MGREINLMPFAAAVLEAIERERQEAKERREKCENLEDKAGSESLKRWSLS